MFLIIMIRRGQESAGDGLADCMIDADMSWLRKGIVAGMLALAFVSARAQTPLAGPEAGLKADPEASSEADPGSENPLLRAPAAIQQAYAQARPYIDDPIAELKDAVPALKGIKAESSQDSLSFLLSRTGEVVAALLPKVPNLAAREELSQVSLPLSGGPATQQVSFGGSGPQYISQRKVDEKELQRILRAKLISPAQWKQYNYLILAHRNPDGPAILEESRTDAQNRSIGREAGSPRSLGFSYAWLRFIPQNSPQSRFRYLGQQKIDRHQTFVVAFAEDPKKVKVPGAIVFEEKLYPLLTQGVAWIDQATYRIVRLQTDLLAPLPSISLLRLSSDLRFSEVRIPEVAEPLWLPKQVEIQWEQENQISAELHQYSGYRLFHATFRMVPAS